VDASTPSTPLENVGLLCLVILLGGDEKEIEQRRPLDLVVGSPA